MKDIDPELLPRKPTSHGATSPEWGINALTATSTPPTGSSKRPSTRTYPAVVAAVHRILIRLESKP